MGRARLALSRLSFLLSLLFLRFFLRLFVSLPPPHRFPPPPSSPSSPSLGVSASAQRVLFSGAQLSDACSLEQVGVTDEAQLFVSLALLGGAKKRKKKTYTKPKKNKHVHKKIKLRVLAFYKVDGSGKVERLRKTCPACGPGVFMANHFDRVYCGKCHQTYVYENKA